MWNFWCVALGGFRRRKNPSLLPVGDQGHLTHHVLATSAVTSFESGNLEQKKDKKHVLYPVKHKKKGVSLISLNILVHHCLLQRVTFQQLINNFHKTNSLSHKATVQGTQRRRVILFCHPGSHHRHAPKSSQVPLSFWCFCNSSLTPQRFSGQWIRQPAIMSYIRSSF